MTWNKLTPAQRLDILTARFRRSRDAAVQPVGSDSARHLERMARLETERPDWVRLIWVHRGNVTAVARSMGYCTNTAHLAIGALGLRSEVRRARRCRAVGGTRGDLAPGRPRTRSEKAAPSSGNVAQAMGGSELTQVPNWEAPWE